MTEGSSSQFSLVGFAVAVSTIGVGTAVGLAVVPVVGSYIGMLLGGFVAGLATEERPLLEAGVAAVLAGLGILAAGALIGNGVVAAVVALGGIAPTTLLTSIVLSFAVGAFGAHFGDDMRDGLTTPVESPPSRSTEPGATAVSLADDEERVREGSDHASTEAETDDESGASERDSDPASRGPEQAESDELELERE